MIETLTREQWLIQFTELLRPRFVEVGSPFPDDVAVSCGWPSKKARANKNRAIGECWNKAVSDAGRPEIFISPLMADSVDVGAVLVHELIHAGNPDAGHKAGFKRVAIPLGLTGKMTATVATPELAESLKQLVDKIGQPYPHSTIHAVDPPKQSTRMLKLLCPGCGYVIRTTRTWLDQGLPTCFCGEGFEEAS